MKKSELKTGMIVILANGSKHMVFRNASTSYDDCADFLVNLDKTCSWHRLSNYTENMEHVGYNNECLNVVEVIQVQHPYNLIEPYKTGYNKTKTLWKRKEKKQYTYAQLKEILGEEFEVVG